MATVVHPSVGAGLSGMPVLSADTKANEVVPDDTDDDTDDEGDVMDVDDGEEGECCSLYPAEVYGSDIALARALAHAHSCSRPAMATATAGSGAAEEEGGRLQGLRLALMSTEEVRALSVVEVVVPSTFTRNLPTPGGVNDLLMGSTDRQLRCGKCKGHCDGHYGHIELTCPILRMSYVKAAVSHLRTCCRACGRAKWQSHGEGDAAMKAAGVAWPGTGKRSPFVNAAHIFAKTPAVGFERIRALADACKNKLTCPWSFPVTLPDGTVVPACGAPQPMYRQGKENKLNILHTYGDKQLAALRDPEERLWALQRLTPDEIRNIIDSTPVLTLAEMGYRIDPDSVEPGPDGKVTPRLLSHPRDFVMQAQLVLPNAVRPSIHLTDGSRCRGEDDLTRAYVGIVRGNLDLAKAQGVYHAARGAAAAAYKRKLAKARKTRDAAVKRLETARAEQIAAAAACAARAAEEEAGVVSSKSAKRGRTTAIDMELATAAFYKAEAAAEEADSVLAGVLVAIEAACAKEQTAFHIAWDKLAVECAALITPTIRKAVKIEGVKEHRHGRASRRKQQGLKERLTGKKGRMRGNLAGRRVDQSARSVVGPDVNHNIWELGVPSVIMRTLTFPVRVTSLNIRKLAERVRKGAGPNVDDGAINVLRPDTTGSTTTLSLSMLDEAGRADLANQLQVGWVVERMLQNGDWVLFNRQPSLHKGSMMSFQIYRVNGHAFKLPLPTTCSYNAGTCSMCLHAPVLCPCYGLLFT